MIILYSRALRKRLGSVCAPTSSAAPDHLCASLSNPFRVAHSLETPSRTCVEGRKLVHSSLINQESTRPHTHARNPRPPTVFNTVPAHIPERALETWPSSPRTLRKLPMKSGGIVPGTAAYIIVRVHRPHARCLAPTSPTSRCGAAFFTWWRSWTGIQCGKTLILDPRRAIGLGTTGPVSPRAKGPTVQGFVCSFTQMETAG